MTRVVHGLWTNELARAKGFSEGCGKWWQRVPVELPEPPWPPITRSARSRRQSARALVCRPGGGGTGGRVRRGMGWLIGSAGLGWSAAQSRIHAEVFLGLTWVARVWGREPFRVVLRAVFFIYPARADEPCPSSDKVCPA